MTLPAELIAGIDQFERNRSRFIPEAVERELVRRRREGLFRSVRIGIPRRPNLPEPACGLGR